MDARADRLLLLRIEIVTDQPEKYAHFCALFARAAKFVYTQIVQVELRYAILVIILQVCARCHVSGRLSQYRNVCARCDCFFARPLENLRALGDNIAHVRTTLDG